MAGDVTIPGTQSKVSKPVAYAGLAATGVLIIVYYRNKKPAAAGAGAAAAGQYPPDGTSGNPGDPYSTDPATGQTYGNEAAGSGGTFGAFGTGAASGMYYDPATGAYDLTSPYGTSPATQPYQTQGGPPFATNSAWSDWVIQELAAQNPSVNTGALTDALGLYLASQPLSAAQRQYAFDAEAIAGPPPVAGPGGFPPNVRGDGGTGGGGGHVTVPDVTGLDYGKASSAIKGAKLLVQPTGVNASWIVTAQSPKPGTSVASGSTVTLTVRDPATTVTVPKVTGLNYGQAYNQIVYGAGLKISPLHVNSHWHITSQKPAAGTHVAKGSTVTVTAKA